MPLPRRDETDPSKPFEFRSRKEITYDPMPPRFEWKAVAYHNENHQRFYLNEEGVLKVIEENGRSLPATPEQITEFRQAVNNTGDNQIIVHVGRLFDPYYDLHRPLSTYTRQELPNPPEDDR